jgi:hypothetical protein
MRIKYLSGCLLACLLTGNVSGSIIIWDDFELNTSSNYSVVSGGGTPSDGTVTFGFDYLAAGIPLAPRSTVGDSRGLRITANDTAGQTNSQTVFNNTIVNAPIYRLTVDVFMAFQGTTGTTEYGQVGVGGNGVTPNSIFTPISGSGSFMAFTGDGGSASDYRWFLSTDNGGPTTYLATDPSHLGNGSNNTGAFFQALFPSPPSTVAGSPGNIWTTVDVVVDNNAKRIQYFMTNTFGTQALIFDSDPNGISPYTGTLEGLVSLGLHDAFASVSPNSVFTVFDNLRVVAVPEPSSLLLLVFGFAGMAVRRRRV